MKFFNLTVASTDQPILINLDTVEFFTPDPNRPSQTRVVFNSSSTIVKESYESIKERI